MAHHQFLCLLMQLIYDGTDTEYCSKQLNKLSVSQRLKMSVIFHGEEKNSASSNCRSYKNLQEAVVLAK